MSAREVFCHSGHDDVERTQYDKTLLVRISFIDFSFFDLAFVILKGIYSFEFPKRFLEISSRDLTSSIFFSHLSILII
jgi:hypothetical protein